MKIDKQYQTSAGNIIRMSLYPASQIHAPRILYLHGFKGFKDWGFVPYIGNRFAASGFTFLAINFSHNGIGENPLEFTELEKFEKNTFLLELEEAEEVAELLVEGHFFDLPKKEKIGLMGHSRGGGIAILAAAAQAQIAAVCTWAAVSTFKRYTPDIIEKWRKNGYTEARNSRTGQVFRLGWQLHSELINYPEKLDITGAVARLSAPLCIVQGEDDPVVQSGEAERIFQSAKSSGTELHYIPQAGHTFGAKHPFTESTPELDLAFMSSLHFFNKHLS